MADFHVKSNSAANANPGWPLLQASLVVNTEKGKRQPKPSDG